MNKRLMVLVFSFGTVICYGYALGGVGAYMAGRKVTFEIAAGLAGGSVCLWLAIRLWRQFLSGIEEETRPPAENSEDKE